MQLIKKYTILLMALFAVITTKAQFVVDPLSLDSIEELKSKEPIEVNFLFSYYEQDGTKSPVTGGIGDEALKDMVGNITLNIPLTNKLKFNFHGGVDMYTSASTDNINNEHGLFTETSASSKDKRVYGDIGIQVDNKKKRYNYGLGVGVSSEYDVKSINYNAFYGKLSKNRNTNYRIKASAFHDFWTLYYPTELRLEEDDNILLSETLRNTYNSVFTIAQDLSPKMKASISLEATFQKGLLSTPFHRVYFIDNKNHDIERLPDNRLKFPIGVYYNIYLNKYLVVKFFYRYYFDDFGVQAHTASIELPIKPVESFAIIPFYRYHTQTSSKYFKQYGYHSVLDQYYTSDFDLGDIQSNRIGAELRYMPYFKVGKISKKNDLTLKKVALRGSKYFRTRENELILKSYIVALELSFRFD